MKYAENPSHIRERNKIWKSKNKSAVNEYTKSYMVERRKSDPLFRLAKLLRGRTHSALKSKNLAKKQSLNEYLGCSIDFLKSYLEAKFQPGMTWENHGLWHIDHRVPVASATNEQELYSLFHYANLQPLWAAENMSKGSRAA